MSDRKLFKVKKDCLDLELCIRTMPKIHLGTMVKAEFTLKLREENIKTDPNSVSTLYLCPVCGGNFPSYELAIRHLHFWHKIPEKHRLRLKLDIIAKKV